MYFMKKVLLGLGLLGLVYFGGSGTQSNSLFMQGMGFVGLLIALIVLYIFGRMIWKGLGCMPSFAILSAIVLFIMYALGMFNNGLAGIGESIVKFIGRDTGGQAVQSSEIPPAPQQESVSFSENFPVEKPMAEKPKELMVEENVEISASLFETPKPVETPSAKREQKQEKGGLIDNVVNALTGNTAKEQPKPFNPNDYPVVYGSVRVITADTLEMYGSYFTLFGIDAPEANQMCADNRGQAYNCGREAAVWLKNWLQDGELECHVIQQDTQGNMIGTCSYGPYDLGAALVNAGWAVANIQQTDAYYPYETQAQQARRGLWQGKFYKPWDWRKLQSRKANIKVLKPKKRKAGLFG